MRRKRQSLIQTWAAVLACLAAVSSSALAGGPGPGIPVPTAPGGDDVETVPIVPGGLPGGVVLEGPWGEIQRALRSVGGSGFVRVLERGSDRVAVIYAGDLELRVDRAALADSSVRVAFLGKKSSGSMSVDGGHLVLRTRAR